MAGVPSTSGIARRVSDANIRRFIDEIYNESDSDDEIDIPVIEERNIIRTDPLVQAPTNVDLPEDVEAGWNSESSELLDHELLQPIPSKHRG